MANLKVIKVYIYIYICIVKILCTIVDTFSDPL